MLVGEFNSEFLKSSNSIVSIIIFNIIQVLQRFVRSCYLKHFIINQTYLSPYPYHSFLVIIILLFRFLRKNLKFHTCPLIIPKER